MWCDEGQIPLCRSAPSVAEATILPLRNHRRLGPEAMESAQETFSTRLHLGAIMRRHSGKMGYLGGTSLTPIPTGTEVEASVAGAHQWH